MPNDTEKRPDFEPVDGAMIAARILRRMPSAQRTRILSAMKEQNEALAISVQERVYNFSEITQLSPKNTQTLVREVEHLDLALSIKNAPQDLQRQLLENMSERKREMIVEETQTTSAEAHKVREAQWRILEKLEELKERGLITKSKALATG